MKSSLGNYAGSSASVHWLEITSQRRGLGEVAKSPLLLYQTEVDTAGSCPEKLCVPAWRDPVRSVIAVVKNRVVGKNQDVCRACTPLNWHHMVSWWVSLVSKLWPLRNEECWHFAFAGCVNSVKRLLYLGVPQGPAWFQWCLHLGTPLYGLPCGLVFSQQDDWL